VHEHGSKEREEIRAGISQEAAGHKSPLANKRVTATQLYKEKQDVQSNQGICDQFTCPGQLTVSGACLVG
jgi:hypothetical protein